MDKQSKFYPPTEIKRTIPLFDPRAASGEQRRPDHPDFMTSSELKKSGFTGMRKNEVGMQYEFWILGEMRKAVTFWDADKDEYAVTKAHIEVFAQDHGGFPAKKD